MGKQQSYLTILSPKNLGLDGVRDETEAAFRYFGANPTHPMINMEGVVIGGFKERLQVRDRLDYERQSRAMLDVARQFNIPTQMATLPRKLEYLTMWYLNTDRKLVLVPSEKSLSEDRRS